MTILAIHGSKNDAKRVSGVGRAPRREPVFQPRYFCLLHARPLTPQSKVHGNQKSIKWLQGQSKFNEMAPRTMPNAWVASVARRAARPSFYRATSA